MLWIDRARLTALRKWSPLARVRSSAVTRGGVYVRLVGGALEVDGERAEALLRRALLLLRLPARCAYPRSCTWNSCHSKPGLLAVPLMRLSGHEHVFIPADVLIVGIIRASGYK